MARRYLVFPTVVLATLVGLYACAPAEPPAPPPAPDTAENIEETSTVSTYSPTRINGHPNLNGVWQAMNAANWNVEGGSARGFEQFWQLGALFAQPAGLPVVEGGTLPYSEAGLRQRDANLEGWPKSDPEAACYRVGLPRQTYLPYPFEIVQGDGDMLFVYAYASSNRPIRISDHWDPDEILIEQYLGWNNGRWEGDTLVIEVFGMNPAWLDRSGNHHFGTVTERYTLMDDNHIWYEATITDEYNYEEPFTIAMPLYKRVEPNAELFDFKCVEFSEILLYGDVLKEPVWESDYIK